MKTRNVCLIILGSSLVVGLAIWLARKHGQWTAKITTATNSSVSVTSPVETHPGRGSPANTNVARQEPSAIASDHSSDLMESKAAEWKQSLEGKNMPIDFWGRVVDQDGQPVSGAKIRMNVRHWHVSQPFSASSSFPQTEVTSDSSGYFEWHGETGDNLEIASVEKLGYKSSPQMLKSFSYGQSPEPFSPNPSEPVVIRMWRLKPTEPTVASRGFYAIVPDGRVYRFDLLKNVKLEGDTALGDIGVQLTRPQSVEPRDRYPWTLKIVGVGGDSVLEANDEFLFEAPESGYQPNITIALDPANRDWTSVLRRSFYFKSRGGTVFGCVKMTVRVDYGGQSAIQTESVLNTNSSRNLQR